MKNLILVSVILMLSVFCNAETVETIDWVQAEQDSINYMFTSALANPQLVNVAKLSVEEISGLVETGTITLYQLALLVNSEQISLQKFSDLLKGIDSAVLSVDVKWCFKNKDKAGLKRYLSGVLDDKQITRLMTWYDKEKTFKDNKVIDFTEYVYGQNCWVIDKTTQTKYYSTKSYTTRINKGGMVVFDVPYTQQDVVQIMQFCKLNKDRIGIVVIGWDDAGYNNYDVAAKYHGLDESVFPTVAENYDRVAGFVWLNMPDVPVYYTVCMSGNYRRWMKAFKRKPNGWAVWNIHQLGANFAKVKQRFSGVDIGLLGMNAFKNQERETNEYVRYLETIKELGYKFSVWVE